jgi:hypothetical protein
MPYTGCIAEETRVECDELWTQTDPATGQKYALPREGGGILPFIVV